MQQLNLQCRRTRELVSLGLDGELSELDSARLESHLAACTSCRELGAELTGLTVALRAVPLEPISRPVSLPQRLRWSLRPLQVGAAAATIAVAAGLAGMVGTVRSHSEQPKFAPGTSAPTDGANALRAIRRSQLVLPPPVGRAGGPAKV